MSLLEVKNLKTHFFSARGIIRAVDGVSFSIEKGGTLGFVGESGCGKSVTALSILKLIPTPPGKIVSGEIILQGEKNGESIDIAKAGEKIVQDIRGRRIAMIFQEPMTALNPVYTIGDQIAESVTTHRKRISKKEVRERVVEMLRLVGVPSPEKRADSYPHELSGGMRQRGMIAMALALEPELLIADEPTTALDVTIQAQILDLLIKLKEDLNMALLLITHDMGVVSETVSEIAVMYCGKIVEKGPAQSIFGNPLHPYTKGLLNSIPSIIKGPKGSRLPVIARKGLDIESELVEVEKGHFVRFFHHE